MCTKPLFSMYSDIATYLLPLPKALRIPRQERKTTGIRDWECQFSRYCDPNGTSRRKEVGTVTVSLPKDPNAQRAL